MNTTPETYAERIEREVNTPLGVCACGNEVFPSDPGYFLHGDGTVECEPCVEYNS